MNPWIIIGWIVLAVIAVPIIAKVVLAILEWAAKTACYFKTRNIPPVKGQKWNQNGTILEIGNRHPNGHFTVISDSLGSRALWDQTDVQWRERVRHRKLFLVSAPSVEPKGPKSADASSNPKSDLGKQGGSA
jgi:hypothetical protein